MDKVIFDTNAYRYLVTDKTYKQIDKLMQRIKKKEADNNIETLISPIVAKELLAHVANKNDPSFEKCLKAIKALYLHSGDDEKYHMIASPELLISKAFFDEVIPSKVETNKAIGQMIYNLAKHPDKRTFRKLQRNLQFNRNHVVQAEIGFATTMRQFINAVDPSATGWRIFADDDKKRTKVLADIRSEKTAFNIALGYIYLVYELLVYSGKIGMMSNEELYHRAKELVRVFPEPIALYRQVLENMVNSEFNLLENSRANFVWDIHLMFNIGNHSIEGSKLYFVTSDKAIITNAVKENAAYTILDFPEYMEYLKA